VPREIERKFLVRDDTWRALAGPPARMRQGYLASTDRASVRIRIVEEAGAFLTIKSAEAGLSRAEFEYEVPVAEARELLALCEGFAVDKVRHEVACGGLTFEIDVFAGENEGLVVAEIELADEAQEVPRPAWLGEEITHDRRYYNASLAAVPFRRW
jgi:adenylate cyclase